MKWYSVKDFLIPVNYGSIFVAVRVDEMCVHTMAKYKYDKKSDKYGWFNDDGNQLMNVSHFCVPDPIEIEP